MLPPVHLAVGYLCYAAYARWRWSRPPESAPAAVAVLGAVLPDLLDKPPWLVGTVEVGRTAGHSLLFAVPVIAAGWVFARRRGDLRIGAAFAVGVLSHLAADVPWHLVSGDYDELGFLLWPLTPMPAYSGTKRLGTVAGFDVTTLWLEAAIVVAGVVAWWRDGLPVPGLSPVRERVG